MRKRVPYTSIHRTPAVQCVRRLPSDGQLLLSLLFIFLALDTLVRPSFPLIVFVFPFSTYWRGLGRLKGGFLSHIP